MDQDEDCPAVQSKKPTIVEYLESYLPFQLPRLKWPKTARNLDRAAARLIEGKSLVIAESMRAQAKEVRARGEARTKLIEVGTEAVVTKIEDGDLLLQRRAIEAAIGNAEIEQSNKERILEFAAIDLEERPPVTDAEAEIDDDWLNEFASLAGKKSNEDVQSLWGKMLAGKIRNANSINIKTLQLMSAIDHADAKFIQEFLVLSLDDDWLYSGKNNEFVSIVDQLRLEELGVVSGAAGVLTKTVTVPEGKAEFGFHFGSWVIQLLKSAGPAYTVNIDGMPLTSFGKYLVTLIDRPKPQAGFVARFVMPFQMQDVTLHLLKIGMRLPDNKGWQVLEREIIS